MKVFFAGYILLLLGVFFLWGIEPLHRGHEASSSPAQTPASALAAATSSLKRALAASPILSSTQKKQATTPEVAVPSASNTLPASTSTPPATNPDPSTTPLTPTETPTTTEIAPPTEASTTPPSQQELIAEEIEVGIHQKINEERTNAGLPALSLNTELSSLARAHSVDMLSNNYFAHDNAAGCSSSCRLTNAGFLWNMSGENIYVMSGYTIAVDRVVEMAIESWMNSAGHRENILNPSFTEEGIGIAFEGTKLYATEDFALPSKLPSIGL